MGNRRLAQLCERIGRRIFDHAVSVDALPGKRFSQV